MTKQNKPPATRQELESRLENLRCGGPLTREQIYNLADAINSGYLSAAQAPEPELASRRITDWRESVDMRELRALYLELYGSPADVNSSADQLVQACLLNARGIREALKAVSTLIRLD